MPLLLAACAAPDHAGPTIGPDTDTALARHGSLFEKRVEKVTEGVYVAIGYALANSILLEGDDGLVIVDVTESVETAREVYTAFRRISDKPIKAIIYTHNHADHVFGGRGFFPDGVPDDLQVYAHDSTNYYINRFANILRPAIATRSARMFGTALPEGEVINAGIGPYLAQGGPAGGSIGLLRPTLTFDSAMTVDVAGLSLELIHVPGETQDQLLVWLPKKRVLLPGDNIYKAFPNLYTIRGTAYRDVLQWVSSLDRMRMLRPVHLVPSHTIPVSGEETVLDLLTHYRDAIQYVHDQTVRGINLGLGPDQLARTVTLPPHLITHPWLQEHYGRVSWSVRNIFNGYLGWFDGDAVNLSPLTAAERGAAVVELAGGYEPALAALEQAMAERRYQWAAELATLLLAARPNPRIKVLKAQALRALAQASENPNDRHYYLTQARELVGDITVDPPELTDDAVAFAKSLPIGDVLASLPVNLNPEKSRTVDRRVLFHFTDLQTDYSVHVRRGIAELTATTIAQPDLEITTRSDVLVEILLQARSVPGALASGELSLGRGVRDVPALLRFLLLFRP